MDFKIAPSVELVHLERYPGYAIGSDGVLYSFLRYGGVAVRAIKPSKDKDGYLVAKMSIGGCRRKVYLHRIVARVFIGPKPEGQEIRHLDGDKRNNSRENIAYGTRSQNREDSRRHGTLLVGSRRPGSKLTEHDVAEIRIGHVNGMSHDALAEKYGVHRSGIGKILRRETWRHVAPESQ